MSSIGNEVVLYIARSSSGFKVETRDGTGLADGIFAKRDTRYFTGKSQKADAESYAEKKAEEHDYRIQYAPMVEA